MWPTSRDRASADMLGLFEASARNAGRACELLDEQGIDPIVVIRWKAIYDTLEAAVDACETVVNVLEGIALKRAHRR